MPLLLTKHRVPPLRPEFVARPRLLERLDAALYHRLTILSAPAGFGKSTLLSEWISRKRRDSDSHRAVAWLTLDEGDNDPARFLAYLIGALQTIFPGTGDGILELLPAVQPHPAASPMIWKQIDVALTALINELAVRSEQRDVESGLYALVLDDYHLVHASAIHAAITFFLDHSPLNLHLIIAGRTDPPLPLAKLRARGQLVEIRAADLRFSLDEATSFLQRTMHLSLSPADITTLEQRTEGWIAGLQLAALSVQGQDPERVSGFVQGFTGTHRHIFDYLAQEVLRRQDKAVRDFLFKTAILDQLCGSLCAAVTGARESQEILERLEAANLFVAPLDSERRWFRYHHLFADVIRARLYRSGSQLDCTPIELHRRAAEWYEQNGLITEAIDHALRAEEPDQAARLVEWIARTLLRRGEMSTLLNWFGALPEGVFRNRPQLALLHAWTLIAAGQMDSAADRLRMAQASEQSEGLAGEMAAVQASLYAFQGDGRRAMELAGYALDQLPPDDVFLRGIVAANLGIPTMLAGDVAAAGRAFSEAARMSKKAGNILIAVLSLCQVAELQIVQGQLYQAAETYREAEKIALDKSGRPRPMTGMIYSGMGEVLREWNELERAERYVTQAIDLTHRWHTLEVGTFDSYLILARIRQAQGDPAGALALIQRAEELAVKLDAMVLDDIFVAISKAHIWLVQGNLESAVRWAETAGLLPFPIEPAIRFEGETVPIPYHLVELVSFVIARLDTLRGHPDLALDLLARFLPQATELGRTRSVIEILILQALAYQARGDITQAVLALERALTLAEPANFTRVFLDHGERMAALLRGIEHNSLAVEPRYLGRLRAASAGQAKDQDQGRDRRSPDPGLPEPLGERELQILQLIAAGLSNREIAQELVIALSTVKWHINNLYGKLGVHSRTQALAYARELDLL